MTLIGARAAPRGLAPLPANVVEVTSFEPSKHVRNLIRFIVGLRSFVAPRVAHSRNYLYNNTYASYILEI